MVWLLIFGVSMYLVPFCRRDDSMLDIGTLGLMTMVGSQVST